MDNKSLVNLIFYTFNKVAGCNKLDLNEIDIKLDVDGDLLIPLECSDDLESQMSEIIFKLMCEINFKEEKWIKIQGKELQSGYELTFFNSNPVIKYLSKNKCEVFLRYIKKYKFKNHFFDYKKDVLLIPIPLMKAG